MIECKMSFEFPFKIFSWLRIFQPHHPISSPRTKKHAVAWWLHHAPLRSLVHPLLLWWFVIGCTAAGRSTATATDVHTRRVLNFSIKATKLCRGFATTLFLGPTAVCTAASATKTTVKAKGSGATT